MRLFWGLLIMLALELGPVARAASSFVIGDTDFLLEGKPFVIRSGEMHYARIPREYWTHRLRMARAMGLNTIGTYVFWNLHEPRQGEFDFTGIADVAEYCRLAQAEGLKVILRPGPYCCAEWDFGGLPWWLLKDPNLRVWTRNPQFLAACHNYFQALGRQLAPLQIHRGGPVILVQVENEYRHFGGDKRYIEALAGMLKQAGFEVPLFTCDAVAFLGKPEAGDLYSAGNFNGDPERWVGKLRALRPQGPLMCGEYYSGWFDNWGQYSRAGSGTKALQSLEWMLAHKVSFNLYMAHGGTTFGFNAGALHPPFMPDITSYDYGAPISEAGWETAQYQLLRQTLAKYTEPGERLPEAPAKNPVLAIPAVPMVEAASLFANLPAPRKSAYPQPMEYYDQPHGCVLYRTKLPKGEPGRLQITQLNDYGAAYLDGKQIGVLDRRLGRNFALVPARTNEAVLDILVEAMGRANYGEAMHTGKGITERVELKGPDRELLLSGWEVFNLPLDAAQLATLSYQAGRAAGPAFYRGIFNLDTPSDTFWDMRSWGKGVVWINGHNLGRFWNIGPQQTLYCPGPWLKRGRNELVVLDFTEPERRVMVGLEQPILKEVLSEARVYNRNHPGQPVDLTGRTPIATGEFGRQPGVLTAEFAPAMGRYFALEALSAQGTNQGIGCAELNLVDAAGQVIPRDRWQVVYASQQLTISADGAASNLLDGWADTGWRTLPPGGTVQPPWCVIIDLGENQIVKAVNMLPLRSATVERIKEYRLHISREPWTGL